MIQYIRKLYNWVVSLSAHKHARSALFSLAFIESSFFPIPPDVLQMSMSVANPKKSYVYALIGTVGSVLGGIFGYWIGTTLWQQLSTYFFQYVPGFSEELFARVSEMYKENAFWAVFTAGFTPIPYKIFTIASGVFQISMKEFILASVFSRGLRFNMIATIFYFFGDKAKKFIDEKFELLTIIFTILFILGFIGLKMMTK